MSSRETILAAVKKAQPPVVPIEQMHSKRERTNAVLPSSKAASGIERFQTLLESIGGRVAFLNDNESIVERVMSLFPGNKRIVSSMRSIEKYFLNKHESIIHHSLQDVDVAVIEARFGVAENGSVWVTEADLKIRVLPFICEHLVAIVDAKNIVDTMHEAYDRIGDENYGFGTFIAGPSKTADIEQSLVLGAHGPKSMTVIIAF